MSQSIRSFILTLERNLSAPVLALILLAVNAYVCFELFTIEYTQYVGSIEAAYIALARWIAEHPSELHWFPLWYGGVPFQNSYPPLLHVLSALYSTVTGQSPALSYHAVTAIMYCFGPVTLFWLACRLSARRWPSFFAALLYSVISFSAVFAPSIGREMGSVLYSRRFNVLTYYGEGPHVASMTLLPLALIALDWALKRRRPIPVLAAALALGAVVLTNWLGAMALAAAILAVLLADLGPQWKRTILWAAGIGATAYTIASPWIPPGTIADIRRNSALVGGEFPLTIVQAGYGAALVVLVIALWFGLRVARASRIIQFTAVSSLILGALCLTHYWFDIYILPQPHRYHLEFEMFAPILIVFTLAGLFQSMPDRARQIAGLVLLIACCAQLEFTARYARGLIEPFDMSQSLPYQAAHAVNRHSPGARVFAKGSSQFWLNAFSDSSQLGGGFAQGISNPILPHINYGIAFTSGDPERTMDWLRVFGIDSIIVNGRESRDIYKDFLDPTKFAGPFPLLWRNGDDYLYRVPRRNRSLAHVITPAGEIQGEPNKVEQHDPIIPLVAALENPDSPPATFEWLQPHHARVTANLQPGQVLYIQVTHHPGWHATVDGEPRVLRRDPIGQMIVEPGCTGPCTVELQYDGGTEMKAAKAASALAILGLLLWTLIDRRRAARSRA